LGASDIASLSAGGTSGSPFIIHSIGVTLNNPGT
jgi:hypothetical protein